VCFLPHTPAPPYPLTLQPLKNPIPLHHCTPKTNSNKKRIWFPHPWSGIFDLTPPFCPLLPQASTHCSSSSPTLHTLFVFSHLVFSYVGRTHPPPPPHSSSLHRAQHSLHPSLLPPFSRLLQHHRRTRIFSK